MTGLSVAVDAGTSFIKVVVLDEDGHEVASDAQRTTVSRPAPSRSEQDMVEVRRAVFTCIASAVDGRQGDVRRVALTAQGDGAWLVAADGSPTGPAVLWNDGRAVDVLRRWQQDGVPEAAFRINGSLSNLGLPNAVLAWLHEHEPDALTDAAAVLTCGGWLFRCLTGVVGLHPSDASAPWLDVATGEVSDTLLDLYRLPWARPLIPPVLSGAASTQPLTAEAAAATGLPAGIPVTMAPYDVVSTATGSGAIAAGDAFCILGTTLCVGARQTAPDTSGTPAGLTILGDPGEPVVRAFPTLAGTGVVDWATDLLGLANPAALVALAATADRTANGLRMWPYLSPAGERAPFLDPAARGVIAGVSFATGRAEVARAVIDGLGHVIKDCLDAVDEPPVRLALAGGGAASDLWCRSIADITGVPTTRRALGQEGARGAVVAALVAEGALDEAGATARIAPAGATFDPDPARADEVARAHADFVETRAVLATRWSAWSEA